MGTPLNVLPSTWTGQTSWQTAPDNADYHDTMPPADEASSPLQDGTINVDLTDANRPVQYISTDIGRQALQEFFESAHELQDDVAAYMRVSFVYTYMYMDVSCEY